MANRRYNAKKIAQTPSLKKKIARFCAHVDVTYTPHNKWTDKIEEILTNGHRGYVSLSEGDLAKEFDKHLEILRNDYSVKKQEDDQSRAEDGKWYCQSEKFVELTLWYEEAVEIANAVFEKEFL